MFTHCTECNKSLVEDPAFNRHYLRSKCNTCFNRIHAENRKNKLRDTSIIPWTCKKCKKIVTDLSDIRWDHNNPRWCMDCDRIYNEKYYHVNGGKLKHRSYILNQKFGISLDEYNELLKLQGGVCAICEQECASGKELAVDHNHNTGEIRGLLCTRCNSAIGNLKEDPKIIMNAYDYLHRTTWNKGLDKVQIHGNERS